MTRRFRPPQIDSRLSEKEREGKRKVSACFRAEEEKGARPLAPAQRERNSVSSSLSLLLKVAKMPPAAAFMDNRPTQE